MHTLTPAAIWAVLTLRYCTSTETDRSQGQNGVEHPVSAKVKSEFLKIF